MSVNPITHFFSQIYYGWRMVGLVSAIRVVGGGLHQYGFTVFFLPISEDLGLSRAATFQLLRLAEYDEQSGRGILRLGGREYPLRRAG